MKMKEFREILTATNGGVSKEEEQKIREFVRKKIKEEKELFELLAKH